MTKAERSKLLAAYAELEAATEAYYLAVDKFRKVYDPKTVGLDELCEDINCVMVEIDEELDEVA